jgi:Skp family chaperone for outer membrane proteins
MSSSGALKATVQNPALKGLFKNLVEGEGGPETLPIVREKAARLREGAVRFARALEVLGRGQWAALFPEDAAALRAYAGVLAAEAAAAFEDPLAPLLAAQLAAKRARDPVAAALEGPDLGALPLEAVAAYRAHFSAAKQSRPVNVAVVTCKNLTPHKHFLKEPEKLVDRFLRGAGLTFEPVPGLPLNFKKVYNDPLLKKTDRDFVLMILHKLYTLGFEVYRALTSPEIDVEEFAEVLQGSIAEVQKQIPRCDDAFRMIMGSLKTLRDNFDDYYRGFAITGNPSLLMENFIQDVARTSASSPKIVGQFQKIIAHYKTATSAASARGDDRLKSLFGAAEANYQSLASAVAAEDAEADRAHAAEVAAEAAAAEAAAAAEVAAAAAAAAAPPRRAAADNARARRAARRAAEPASPGAPPAGPSGAPAGGDAEALAEPVDLPGDGGGDGTALSAAFGGPPAPGGEGRGLAAPAEAETLATDECASASESGGDASEDAGGGAGDSTPEAASAGAGDSAPEAAGADAGDSAPEAAGADAGDSAPEAAGDSAPEAAGDSGDGGISGDGASDSGEGAGDLASEARAAMAVLAEDDEAGLDPFQLIMARMGGGQGPEEQLQVALARLTGDLGLSLAEAGEASGAGAGGPGAGAASRDD